MVVDYLIKMQGQRRRYRPIASQQGEQQRSMRQSPAQASPAGSIEAQVQQIGQYVQNLIQNGIDTNFLYERNNLLLFLVVIVVLVFYIFVGLNLRTEANLRDVVKSPSLAVKQAILNGSIQANSTNAPHNFVGIKKDPQLTLLQNSQNSQKQENNSTKTQTNKIRQANLKEKGE